MGQDSTNIEVKTVGNVHPHRTALSSSSLRLDYLLSVGSQTPKPTFLQSPNGRHSGTASSPLADTPTPSEPHERRRGSLTGTGLTGSRSSVGYRPGEGLAGRSQISVPHSRAWWRSRPPKTAARPVPSWHLAGGGPKRQTS
jgi:hypothetical protein